MPDKSFCNDAQERFVISSDNACY